MDAGKREQVLSIIPHITGTMSVIGSCSILYDILSDRHVKIQRPFYRIMLVMSLVDAIASFPSALSTLPIPAGTEGVYGARGNTQTCTAQGFFIQLLAMSPFYNMILSAYYLLVGKYHMAEEDIVKYEKFMHLTAITLGTGFAILGLPLTLYNNANLWCWIASYPANCEDASGKPGPVTCERGQNAWLFRWLIFYGPIWLAIFAVIIMMIMLTLSIYSEEKRTVMLQNDLRREANVNFDGSNSSMYDTNRYERSQQMLRQAFFFVMAFLVTWLFSSANRLYQLITGKSSFALLIGHSIFGPLQGFLNFIVYRHGKVMA